RVQHEIDRHEDGPYACDRKTYGGKRMRVSRQDRNPIALRDASVEQGVSDSMADAIELGIRPPNIAANDRVLVRDAPGRAPENFADVLLPDHVGGRSLIAHCCLLLVCALGLFSADYPPFDGRPRDSDLGPTGETLSEYRNRPGRGAPVLRRVQLT